MHKLFLSFIDYIAASFIIYVILSVISNSHYLIIYTCVYNLTAISLD
jgi:uncharacterized membrane protein YbhN (UPF0104 family)